MRLIFPGCYVLKRFLVETKNDQLLKIEKFIYYIVYIGCDVELSHSGYAFDNHKLNLDLPSGRIRSGSETDYLNSFTTFSSQHPKSIFTQNFLIKSIAFSLAHTRKKVFLLELPYPP